MVETILLDLEKYNLFINDTILCFQHVNFFKNFE